MQYQLFPKQINLLLPAVLLLSLQTAVMAKVPMAEIGKNKIKLEVAQTREQIERGLMFRQSMPEDHGMVFLFHPPRNVRFWMFHCNMSLDMLFIKDGKIVKISHDVPPCRSQKPGDCPLYPSEGEIEASEVLETNAGYCERHGVKENDSVNFDLPGLKNADSKKKEETAGAALESEPGQNK